MHKIIITGGCGFIGSHLSEYILKYLENHRSLLLIKLLMQQIKKIFQKL